MLNKLFSIFVITLFLSSFVVAGEGFGNRDGPIREAINNNQNDNQGNLRDRISAKPDTNAPTESFEVPNETDIFDDLDGLEWKIDPPVWHDASEIKVEVDGEFYSLQEAIDHGLISFPVEEIPEGVLFSFQIPVGNANDYEVMCPRGIKNLGTRYVEYKDPENELRIDNPLIYEEGVYDFACTVGDNRKVLTRRIQLTNEYSHLITEERPRVSRTVAVLNDRKVYNGIDIFAYSIALQNGELKIRIENIQSCRANRIDQITAPICVPKLNLFGSNLDSDLEDNEYELLQRPGTTPDIIAGQPAPNGYGCYGGVGGIHPAYCDQPTVCQSAPCSTGSSPTPLFGGITCPTSVTIPIPEYSCNLFQCPAYEVRSGAFGLFQKETIYNWDGITCSISSAF